MAQALNKTRVKQVAVSRSRASKAKRDETARKSAEQDAELERMLLLIDSKLDDIDQRLQGIMDRRGQAMS